MAILFIFLVIYRAGLTHKQTKHVLRAPGIGGHQAPKNKKTKTYPVKAEKHERKIILVEDGAPN